MRTRQAQQLQADVFARLDEVTGVNGAGFSTGVKPAPADLLEWLNQEWADLYSFLVDSDTHWNQRQTIFQTVSGVDSYGAQLGAWTAALTGLTLVSGGSYKGAANPPATITGANGSGVGATATSVGLGGSFSPWPITAVTLTNAGVGYQMPVSVTFADAVLTPAVVTPILLGDFWKGDGVDIQISGTQWFPAERFQWQQRDDYTTADWSWPRRILYDYIGGTADASGADGTMLKFLPVPSGGYTVRHWWYPAPQRMVAPTDVIDGVNGAEMAIILGACQQACLQTEQFELADRYGAMRAEKWQRIVSSLRDRNNAEAPRARVVRGRAGAHGRYRWWGP